MSGNRFEGGARDVGGRVKDAVGGLTGDTQTQAEGKLDQVAGRAQQQYGNAANAASGAMGEMTDYVRQQPITALLIAAGVGWLIGRTL